jgi:hypothetical protein
LRALFAGNTVPAEIAGQNAVQKYMGKNRDRTGGRINRHLNKKKPVDESTGF